GWRQLCASCVPGTSSPPARNVAGMAYDPIANKAVLFGGAGDSGGLNDTWLFDPVQSTWAPGSPTSAPPARDRAAMAYYPTLRTVLLFSGEDNVGNDLADTWTWNGQTNQWTQQSPPVAPRRESRRALRPTWACRWRCCSAVRIPTATSCKTPGSGVPSWAPRR
ncbi:MAG: Kelch repeat-containing protein, partial [Dehalococcoidia bacterium]